MRIQAKKEIVVLVANAAFLLFPLGASANLITNSSFELGPGGVAVMASDWNIRSNTPDIFGPFAAWIDGVYGTGQTAQDGTRWAGGYSDGSTIEAFDQVLNTPLIAGQPYYLSAYLLEANPSYTIGAGGYEVWLGTNSSIDVLLGVLGTTTTKNVWQYRDFSFVAPANAASLTSIIFSPMPVASTESWTGIDSISLTPSTVPIPAAVWLFGSALGVMGWMRRKAAS